MRWGWIAAVVMGVVLGIAFAMWMGEMGETIWVIS